MSSIGVIIARFQSPYLHEGHLSLIDSVSQKHNKTVIFLGVSPVRGSRRNPLDFPTREKMIKQAYPNLYVLPLADHPLDTKWSQNLDSMLANTFPGSKFILYGSRDSFINYYSGHAQVVELPEKGQHNSTLIREQLSDKVLGTEEFRAGIIYAYSNMYEKVFPTVDIAVFRNNKTELLLGKKAIDNKWRLPGGFSDPTDENFEAAAQRELREECGDISITSMQYEGSFRINDWRYRKEVDKIITTLFSTELVSGDALGSDDIAVVQWFTLDEVKQKVENNETAAEHHAMLTTLLRKYTR